MIPQSSTYIVIPFRNPSIYARFFVVLLELLLVRGFIRYNEYCRILSLLFGGVVRN